VTALTVSDLSEDLPFGARISGVTQEALKDETNRELIRQTLRERGVIVSENIEQTGQMQVALSNVLGPLKDHPVARVERADEDLAPGVIAIRSDGDTMMVEEDGKQQTARHLAAVAFRPLLSGRAQLCRRAAFGQPAERGRHDRLCRRYPDLEGPARRAEGKDRRQDRHPHAVPASR
jgi:hypothetical protein